MDRKKELFKNTFIILLGKGCTQFLSFFLLPLYTSVLLKDDFGIVDLLNTYISLLVPIITLQLENAGFRYLVDCRENFKQKSVVITNLILAVIIQILLSFILFFIIGLYININYQYYLAFCTIATIFSNLSLQITRGIGKNFDYAVASIITAISTLILNVFFLLVLKMGPRGLFLSTILSNLICCIYLVIKNKIYNNFRIKYYDKKEIFKLLQYSIPLVPNGVIWWIINAADRSIISLFLGNSINGLYAVANKFSNILISVYNVFNIAWTEFISIHINDKENYKFLSELVNDLIKFFSFACLGVISIMPFIFKYLVDVNYEASYNYIPLLIVSTIFNIMAALFGSFYIAKKETKKIAKTSLSSGIINVVINIIFVKYIGVYASILSSIIAFLIMSIWRYIDIQKYIRLKLELKPIILLVILYVFTIVTYYSNNMFINTLTLITNLIFAIVINSKFIKSFHIIFNKQ